MNPTTRIHRRTRRFVAAHFLTAALVLFGSVGGHAQTTAESAGELEDLVSEGGEELSLLIPNQPTQTVFGFGKSAVDTPRSYTEISSELLDKLAISNSEDIARVAPSTYSTFRFGLQGGVAVRGQTSDFYFRGMRRIDPQGNYRTIFSANDSIEIVRGPPSPIYGLGRIGGYLNFNPKTARLSRTGKYLDKPTGLVSYTTGSYDKNILRLDVGGPVSIAGREGGYQVFAYYEDSDSYYTISPNDRHKIIQATLTLDLTSSWRLETGGVYQDSFGGLPGGINRTTQNLIDNGKYWNGTFSYQMDLNGDGSISDFEMLDSYAGNTGFRQALGTTGGNNTGFSTVYRGQQNDPMRRRIPWQGGPINGGTITVDQFLAGYSTTVRDAAGNPMTVQRQGYQMMIYPLGPDGQRNLAATPTPLYMPYAFDPALGTWEEVDFDYTKSFGEDYYKARVATFFFDMINDSNPNFTMKNQVLLDYQDQEKTGRNPFSQFQEITQIENKFTIMKSFDPDVSWFETTVLASANAFYHDSHRVSDNGDYDFRRSLMTGFTPQDTFFAYTQGDRTMNTSAANRNDASVWTSYGIGLLADTTLFDKLGLLTGWRFDGVDGWGETAAGIYNRQGNGNPNTPRNYGKGNEHGTSWSVNASYGLTEWFKPYYTYAVQTAPILDGSTGAIPPANTRNILAASVIKEAGIKGSAFDGRLFYAAAAYVQTRNNWDPDEGAGAIGATEGRGLELEARYMATKKLSFLGSITSSKTVNIVSSGNVTTNARTLGFPDVVDANGRVVIPAEAFGWGGIVSTTIPVGDDRFKEVPGRPRRVANLTAMYQLTPAWSFRLTGYYQSKFYNDQLRSFRVPSATAFDGGITYTPNEDWRVTLNVQNLLDRTYYSAGSFQSVSQRLPRMFDLSVQRNF
jgi:outer membrane receptor protein involved in Fe transport